MQIEFQPSGEGGTRIPLNSCGIMANLEISGALLEVQRVWPHLSLSQAEAIVRIVREGL
jgi:hypothetical protein